jgi:hypothetical protein
VDTFDEVFAAQHGWASIEETTDSPNNGVYRTVDSGRTWTQVRIP